MTFLTLPSRRRLGNALAFGLALGLLLAAIPRVPALAAPTTYYLASDGVPLASLSPTAPTATTLPNYDPGRDGVPGLMLEPTLVAEMSETDPAKYQRWSAAKGGGDIDGPVTLTVWSASEGFAVDKRGTIRVGLYDCNEPAASCSLIAYDLHGADPWSPSGEWTEVTVAWPDVQYSIPNGHHLEVKLVAGITSETPLLFAYDTVDYPSRLTVSGGTANDPPTAADDVATTDEDVAVVVDLVGNDSDSNGDAISVTAITQAANGLVVDNNDGTATYTPDPDWSGSDGFTYTISDGAETATGSVVLTVGPVNDRPVAGDDADATTEDTILVIDVLANDSDVDGDRLSIVSLTQPANGAATNNGDGTIAYEPAAHWSGVAIFTYDVSDGVLFDTGTVTVDVGASNDAPQPTDDTASVPEDGSVTVDVLANDTDIDGDSLAVVDIGAAANGSVVGNNDGTLSYTPDADFNGVEIIGYTVSDGVATARGQLTIIVTPVNDAPTASDVFFTLHEDSNVSFDPLSGVGDADGDPLVLANVTQPAHAAVTVEIDGRLTVTPDPDWNGETGFEFAVDDGIATIAVSVGIAVVPVNDAPVAADDSVTTGEDTPVLIDVLANDSDADGDDLALAAVVGGGSGAGSVEGGVIRYEPASDWSGVDTVAYTVTDGAITVAGIVTVTVTPVNDAPVAGEDSAVLDEDGVVTLDVLSNDHDVDGDVLSLRAVGTPRLGRVSIADGSLRYTPDHDVNGTDTFTYSVADAAGLTALGVVTVVIRPVNDAPVAVADAVTTDEDSAIRVSVLGNDTDVEGDALSVVLSSAPSAGRAVVGDDGAIVFTPDPDWHGQASLRYAVSDGALSDTASLAITVRPVNDDPLAGGDRMWISEDGHGFLRPLGNDTDIDGDHLSIAAWTDPSHGVLTAADGLINYVPDADYFGRDIFSYTVADGNGGFAAAMVQIDVGPVDDIPVVGDDAATTPSGRPISIRVLGNDIDVDGDRLSVVTFTQGNHGTVTDGGDGTLIYAPGPDFVSTDTFLYVVTDGFTAQSAQVTVTRQIDGAALVETSLSPPPPVFKQWVDARSPASVVSDEVTDTIGVLAIPAALTAAAAGGTALAQSELAIRVFGRLARLVFGRF